jgi:hypothetical protein
MQLTAMRGIKHLSALATAITICWSAARAETVMQETSFGAFTLVREIKTRDPGEPLIMHVATEWTKLHLRWRSRTGDMRVELIDNGGMLEIDMDGHECSSGARYLRYGKRLGEPALWSDMNSMLASLTKICPRIEPARRAAYAAEFALARDDYVAGIEALKKRAARLLNPSLTRCRRLQTSVIPDPYALCRDYW